MPKLVLSAVAALAVVTVLTSCAIPEALFSNDPVPSTASAGSSAPPDHLPLVGGIELSGEPDVVAITADQLTEDGWLKITSQGETIFENGDCVLRLHAEQQSSSTTGVDDYANTELALIEFLGSKSWIGVLPMAWPLNGAESTLEALVVADIDESGDVRFTMARAIGDLEIAFVASLVCDPGIAPEIVFVEKVLPAIRVELR